MTKRKCGSMAVVTVLAALGPLLHGAPKTNDQLIVESRLSYTNVCEMRRNKQPAPIYELLLFDKTHSQLTMQDLAGNERGDLYVG